MWVDLNALRAEQMKKVKKGDQDVMFLIQKAVRKPAKSTEYSSLMHTHHIYLDRPVVISGNLKFRLGGSTFQLCNLPQDW